jgi:hypothetical protein
MSAGGREDEPDVHADIDAAREMTSIEALVGFICPVAA